MKVQRPGMRAALARDLALARAALGAARRLAGIRTDLRELADELGRGLFAELDYRQEAANAAAFARAHAHLPGVAVPAPVPSLSTGRVLTAEWVEGITPYDLASAGPSGRGALLGLVARGVECSLSQLLETGLMHADTHPGNLLLADYPRRPVGDDRVEEERGGGEGGGGGGDGLAGKLSLVYLDFGLVVRVSIRDRAALAAGALHLAGRDTRALADDLADLGCLKVGVAGWRAGGLAG